MLAFVPCLIWRFMSKRSGVNMAAIVDAARHCSQAHYLEIREKAIRYVVNQMDRYLLAQREYRTGCMVRIKHIAAKFCCIVGGKTEMAAIYRALRSPPHPQYASTPFPEPRGLR